MNAERGATSLIHHIIILDSTSTTGGRKTGLAYNTASLVCRKIRPGETITTSITIEDISTLGTYAAPTSNAHVRFKEVDATNWPGLYEVHLHNDWLDTTNSRRALRFCFRGATGMVQCDVEIPLTGMNLNDSVRGGMTALPNAAAEAAGGLYTRGTGAGQINQPANGQIDANAVKVGGTTQTGRDLGASVLLSPGTGTGQVSLSSGAVTVGTNNDKTGYGLAAAQTCNITGNLSGSVGSVTGAVGSVAGNVAGNVVGSVGSVASFGTLIADIWSYLLTAITTGGSIGKLIKDYLDAAISSRSTVTTAQVNAECDTALADVGLTSTITGRIDAAVSTRSTLDAAGVRSAVGLESANLDTQLGAIDDYLDTEMAAALAVLVRLNSALEPDGAVYRFTTNALEQGPGGGSAPSAADIADAVWDEAAAGHTGAGSFGQKLNAAGGASDPLTNMLSGYGAGTAGKGLEILLAAAAGKCVHDQAARTRKLYAEDGTTLLRTLTAESDATGAIITETPS